MRVPAGGATGNRVALPRKRRRICCVIGRNFDYNIATNCRVLPTRPLTLAMCSTSKSEYTFFAEFLPRVGVYQLSFSHADNCRLIISPRGVVKSGLRHSEGVEEEEICKWPPHLPDLVPGSFLDPLKLAPAKSEPLQLRFRSSGPPPAEFERILDPPDFAPSLRSTLFVVRCGFCGNALTRRN